MATRNAPSRQARGGRTIGVEIGSHAIRAVELDVHGDQMRVTKRGQAPVPPGTWDRLAAVRDELAQAIRSALANGGIAPGPIVTAVPRRLVTLKYGKLPHGSPEQIRGMVQFEAQQYIPFPLEEVVLDHQVVSDETEDLATVMVVAVRRHIVDDLLAAFDKAGLQVARISVSALALAEHSQAGIVPVGLLDVDGTEMDMAVVADGRLLFTRAVALESPTSSQQGREELVGEVARSVAAYQNEYRTRPLSKLVLSAPDGKAGDGIEDTLAGLLEIPIARMNGRYLPETDPDAHVYTTAIGLALEGSSRGMNRVNLVPPSREENRLAARRKVGGSVAAVAVTALAIAGGIFAFTAYNAQQKEMVAAAGANNELKGDQTRLINAQTEHDWTAKSYQLVADGLQRTAPAVDVLKAVSDSVPPGGGIYLTQMAFTRNGLLTLHGNAHDEAAATELVLGLQGSGAFDQVRLDYMGDARTDTVKGGAPAAPSGGATAPKASKLPAAPGTKPPTGPAPSAASATPMSFIVSCRVINGPRPLWALQAKPGAKAHAGKKAGARAASGTSTAPTESDTSDTSDEEMMGDE